MRENPVVIESRASSHIYRTARTKGVHGISLEMRRAWPTCCKARVVSAVVFTRSDIFMTHSRSTATSMVNREFQSLDFLEIRQRIKYC